MANMNVATKIIILIILLILLGTINTAISKIILNTKSLGIFFTHIWLMTLEMFIGEFLCFIFYIFADKSNVDGKPEISIFKLAIPPSLDLCASTLSCVGLIFLPGSIFQMLRGSLIIFTLLLSLFILKNKHNINHYTGVVLTIIGLFLVGFASSIINKMKNNNTDENSKSMLLGIFLILFGQFLQACQMIFEENVMKNYHCHPLKCVGSEGMFGFAFTVVIMIILQFIKCTPNTLFSKGFCISDEYNVFRMSNILFAFRQFQNNKSLIVLNVAYICAIAGFNFSGIALSKYTCGTTRAVIDSVRTILVWCFFMMPFNSVRTRENFNFIQLSGFLFLIAGNLFYNEIISSDEKTEYFRLPKNEGNNDENNINLNEEEINLERNDLELD